MLGLLDCATKLTAPQDEKREYLDPRLKPHASGQIYCSQQGCRSVRKGRTVRKQNGMNEYVSRLGALRTLFEAANEEITRSEFKTFSGRLFEQHPGILRVGWIPRIRRKERAEFEAAAPCGPTAAASSGSHGLPRLSHRDRFSFTPTSSTWRRRSAAFASACQLRRRSR